jgi:hypothetical protein
VINIVHKSELHHIPSLADVNIVTKLFTVGQKDLKALLASGIKDVWMSFELLGRFS